MVCCHENLNSVESKADEEMMPEEANLAKASEELGVAEVVGVVQDHWAHLKPSNVDSQDDDESVCEKSCSQEWWR